MYIGIVVQKSDFVAIKLQMRRQTCASASEKSIAKLTIGRTPSSCLSLKLSSLVLTYSDDVEVTLFGQVQHNKSTS